MKFFPPASSILLAACLLLAGCGQFGLPDWSRYDEVPDDVRAQPRLVQSAPPLTGNEGWARLGDVPFKPKDFSTKPVYDHYMNELEYDRAEAQDAKQKADAEPPVLPEGDMPVSGGGTAAAQKSLPGLTPPQLPKE